MDARIRPAVAMPIDTRHGDYLISDDASRIDVGVIHRYLSQESYWAKGIPREVVDCAVANSLCFGVYSPGGVQVGFARVVTDYATHGWIGDVFILDAHRRRGLGKALVQAIISHPRLQRLRRLTLATNDAHGLYAQFGFVSPAHPETAMERRNSTPWPSPAV